MYDVYIINLDKRNDRYEKIVKNINTYSKILNIKRFSAISPDNSGTKYAPWIYCALSHLSLIEMAKEKNLDYIMVMEDDNQIVSDLFDEKLTRLMQLPVNMWNVFNGNPTYVNRNASSIKCVFPCPIMVSYKYGKTTNFMIYRKSSYDKILLLKQWYLELIYDVYTCNRHYNLNYEMHAFDVLLCHNELDLSFITIYPYLTTQYTDYSDIDGAVVNYNHCIRDFGYNIIRAMIGNKYVSCIIMGGLGNQIFALCAAFSLALKNNCYLLCEEKNHVKCADREINEYWDTIFKFLDFNNEHLKYNGYDEYFRESGGDWGKYIEINKTKDRLMIDGYFQNAEYFDKYRNEIKIFLGFNTYFDINQKINTKLNPNLNINYKEKYSWLFDNCDKYFVAIHVRRGDYIKLQDYHHIVPMEYYNKCMSIIQSRREAGLILQTVKKVVFSDDIAWCKEHFIETSKTDNYIFIENESDYIEMILLSYFNAFILSNSTFSWWGAYLSDKLNKLVYMPGQWFNKEEMKQTYPNGLLMPSWNKITY